MIKKNKRKVLITGADGFIGSHLTEYLFSKGYEIHALSLYNSFNSWGWLEKISCLKEINVISGDVRDQNFCNKITEGIDYVFNLAALIAIPYSYTAPESYIDTNVKGCLNICQASLKNNVKRLIHTSTSEVYGTAKYVPIDESHALQPQSPYSASKIAADSLALSFYNSFKLPVSIARPFNTYGPRQSARAIIPSVIIQIAKGAKELKIGDLKPTRDFSYVTDTCEGFYSILKSSKTIGGTYNIGTNKEYSIEETVTMIKELMSSDIKIKADKKRLRPSSSEVFRLRCNAKLLEDTAGFKYKVKFKDGLKKTIQWFTDYENLSNYRSEIYNT